MNHSHCKWRHRSESIANVFSSRLPQSSQRPASLRINRSRRRTKAQACKSSHIILVLRYFAVESTINAGRAIVTGRTLDEKSARQLHAPIRYAKTPVTNKENLSCNFCGFSFSTAVALARKGAPVPVAPTIKTFSSCPILFGSMQIC